MGTQAQTRELLAAWQAEYETRAARASELTETAQQAKEAREKAWKRVRRVERTKDTAQIHEALTAYNEAITAYEGAEKEAEKAKWSAFDARRVASQLEDMLPETRARMAQLANAAEAVARLMAPCKETGAGHHLAVGTSSGYLGGEHFSAAGVYCHECRASVYISEFDAALAILGEARLQGLLDREVLVLPAAPAAPAKELVAQ